MPESIESGSDHKVALEEILSGAVVKLPEVSRARIRGNVLASVAITSKPGFAGAMFMRAAAAFSALAIGMGGLSYAAASAVPGSVLYPVKRAVEETQVALIPGDTNKADALQEMAEERVREMHKLIEMDASRESMGKALSGFKDAAERAIEADPEQAHQRASEIEESVESIPDPVRERVNEQVPALSPDRSPRRVSRPIPRGRRGPGHSQKTLNRLRDRVGLIPVPRTLQVNREIPERASRNFRTLRNVPVCGGAWKRQGVFDDAHQ